MLVRLWIEKTKLDRRIARYEGCLQLLDQLEKSSLRTREREIAKRLVLSEVIIKFYIHNILGELDVTSRTQAIAKDRGLDLI